MVVNTLDIWFFLILLILTSGTFWLEIEIGRRRWVRLYNIIVVIFTGFVFPYYSYRNEWLLVFINDWGGKYGSHDSFELWYTVLQFPLYWSIGFILISITTSVLYFRKNSFKLMIKNWFEL